MKNRRSWGAGLVIAACLGGAPSPALALIPGNSTINVPISIATNAQFAAKAVSDLSGGAIVAWTDRRSGTDDIYAQHYLASGAVDPAWPANGLALCTAPGLQQSVAIASDGAGGAIVTWYDNRSISNLDIYAQHVLVSGAVDPAWPVNGLGICVDANFQDSPDIVSDGVGGAIISWKDSRGGNKVYAQRALASGVVDGSWPVNGLAICGAAGNQGGPRIASDGAGGAIVTWDDQRAGSGLVDVYAQHLLPAGTLDGTWPVHGVALCTATGQQTSPRIGSDGAGGAIVTWRDLRAGVGPFDFDIYAQRVLVSGVVDPGWPIDGVAVCTAIQQQTNPAILTDNSGGAIIVWQDMRNFYLGTIDIYAQRVLGSGVVDSAWPVNGLALCTAPDNQFDPAMVSDGAGGAIVTWGDQRGGPGDIYAQHLLSSGAVDPAWPLNGFAVCSAVSHQERPTIVSDGVGGAIMAWSDSRNGNQDIYAQGVESSGALRPLPAEIITASAGPDGSISPSGAVVVFDGGSQTFTITPSDCASIGDVVVDGNSVGAVSSYTFTNVLQNHTIVALFEECALGAIAGRVTASCPVPGTPIAGVIVDAFAVGSGDLLGTATTDADGNYSIPDILVGDYTVTLVTPLGYSTATSEQSVTVAGATTATADFDLVCVASSGDPRSSGFWKHQFGVATGGNGNAQLDAAALCSYLDMIELHFNDNALNQVVVYDPPDGSTCAQKLELAKGLLNLGGSAAAIDKARQQLLSLLLNVAANYLSLNDVISKDGATASQAVTYCDQIIDNPSGDDALAASIADKINSGQKVNAGVIPLGTQSIAYALGGRPLEFSVGRNPGSGPRSFQFRLTAPAKVDLSIYDVQGRRVARVYTGELGEGRHALPWNGSTTRGDRLGRGVYFSRLTAGGEVRVAKLVQTAP